MSSQQIAAYLYEVGSNQRKLEYCRQILAANPNFTPEGIFNHNASQPRSNVTRTEFGELLKALGISSSPQEAELIFSYFQIDAKNYLTLQEFSSLITPQADPALKSLITKRRGEALELDYSIRYALQKFFGQVVENQVRLELLCKFTFEKEREERSKFRRATADAIKEFLALHGKYPGDAEVALILKEVGLSKGDSKRNKLIAEYIVTFNEKKRTNQEPPKVYQREPTIIADFRTKYQTTIQQQEAIASNKLQTALKPQFSQLYSKPSLLQNSRNRDPEVIAARTNQFASTISTVSQVEQRIKTLMGSINIKPSVKKQEHNQSKLLPLDSAKPKEYPKSVKQEVRRQKESQKSSASKPISKRLDFKDKDTIIKEIYSIDNKSQRRDLTERDRPKSNYQFETYTDRNKTDRFLNRNKRITEDNFETESNNSNSQLQIQKRTDKRPVAAKYNESESKKRIEYLKSLVDRKENL